MCGIFGCAKGENKQNEKNLVKLIISQKYLAPKIYLNCDIICTFVL